MSKLTFQEWVSDFGGPTRLAEKLNMTDRALHFWLNKKGSPRIPTMRELIKLSGGKLTYEIIIDSTYPKKARQ